MIAVHKIYIGTLWYPYKQSIIPMCLRDIECIPAHMRNLFMRCRYLLHTAIQETKPLYTGGFFTACKKNLKTDTDAKQRRLTINAFANGRDQTGCLELLHAVAKSSHPWQDDFVRSKNLVGFSAHANICAQCSKGLLNAE